MMTEPSTIILREIMAVLTNRYYAFAGRKDEPDAKGWETFLAHYPEMPKDVEVIADMGNPARYDWYQVVDLNTGDVILERTL
jgi:hypothetical protein